MKNRNSISAVAAAITVAAWYGLYLFLHPHLPALDRRPHEAAGEVLAAEAVRFLGPGARLIVFARDPAPFPVPACAAQLDGFLRALKKSGKSVAATRRFKLDPLRVAAVPPGEFLDQMRFGKDDDVIVSFLGPPALDGPQLAKLGNKRSPVLAVCSGALPTHVDLKRLFDQKLLVAAIISRSDMPAAAGGPRSAFDRMFQLITPANLQDLPPAALAGN